MLSKGPAHPQTPSLCGPTRKKSGYSWALSAGPSGCPAHTAPHLAKAAFAQDLVEGEVLNAAPGAAAFPDLAVGPIVICWGDGAFKVSVCKTLSPGA
jgi:hypothetical protein